MATKTQSRKCPACNNMVRFDYPTFPYCRFHAHLAKDDLSLMKKGTQYSFESNRNMLYDPGSASIPRSRMSQYALSRSSVGTGLSSSSISSIGSSWATASSHVNLFDPEDSFNNRDSIISAVAPQVESALSKDSGITNPHVSIARCSNSTVTMPDGIMKNLVNEHAVIYATYDNGPTVVVDVAPAAALRGIFKKGRKVTDIFPSGQSNFSDGITISSLYEYAVYSSLNVGVMYDAKTNDVLWSSDSGLGKDSPDVISQRNLIDTSPEIVFPPVVRGVSPTDKDLAKMKRNTQENLVEDDLEKLFLEDM